jgi:hypothetical protein
MFQRADKPSLPSTSVSALPGMLGVPELAHLVPDDALHGQQVVRARGAIHHGGDVADAGEHDQAGLGVDGGDGHHRAAGGLQGHVAARQDVRWRVAFAAVEEHLDRGPRRRRGQRPVPQAVDDAHALPLAAAGRRPRIAALLLAAHRRRADAELQRAGLELRCPAVARDAAEDGRALPRDGEDVEDVGCALDHPESEAQAPAGGMAVPQGGREVVEARPAVERDELHPVAVPGDRHRAAGGVLDQVGGRLGGHQCGPPEVGVGETLRAAELGRQPPDLGDLALLGDF